MDVKLAGRGSDSSSQKKNVTLCVYVCVQSIPAWTPNDELTGPYSKSASHHTT